MKKFNDVQRLEAQNPPVVDYVYDAIGIAWVVDNTSATYFTLSKKDIVGLMLDRTGNTGLTGFLLVNGGLPSSTSDHQEGISLAADDNAAATDPILATFYDDNNTKDLRYSYQASCVASSGTFRLAINTPSNKVYPNPFSDAINIAPLMNCGNDFDYIVNIYDVMGRIVFTRVAKGNEQIIWNPSKTIAQGTYNLKITTSQGELISSQNIIKQ